MRNPYPRPTTHRALPQTTKGRWPRSLATLLGLLLAFGARAQQSANFFADDNAARQAAATSPLARALTASRPLTLNVPALRTALTSAPLETQAGARPLVLTLPLPDGTNARFQLLEAPVMEPGLAAQFPAIKTYAGVGLDDPTASVRLDLTPQGLHAQVLSAATGGFYIDPATRTTGPTAYLSFWKRDMPGQAFACGVKGAGKSKAAGQGSTTGQRTSGPTLRTYRLAVAATGEYTAFQSASLGSGATAAQKIAITQAAIVTSVNRVVGVYEKELAVRMVLVANNSSLIYTDATTDPYTNTDPDMLLTQNQANVDAIIQTANYDIGHVFSTGGGGLAGLGVVCRASQKAQGETGSSSPTTDAFDIDFVAHEMGHQFGANHSFNGDNTNCGPNRNAGTAYEPGSGTTIMGYAGVCTAGNNVQSHSDAYFHVVSYEEIQTYLATTSCAASSASGNTPPVVTLPASGKVLPISTPFKLTAGGYDPDNDAVTYDWEEYDLGSIGSPTATQAAGNNAPLFRSFYPSTSQTRYFPRLADVISGTATLGERLPTVSRSLTFRVTLRDKFTTANTGMGVVGSVNSSPNVALTSVSTAGPFLVTAPNTAVNWAGNSTQTITWDVANTSVAPVSCATVNIRLSTDGGLTYPTVLLAGVPNNGTASVTLPSVATTTARVMVEAADNYFFDISNANFTITASPVCTTPSSVTVSSITATTASVSFTGGGTATSYTVTTSPATTSQVVTASSANLTGLTAGTTYTVYVQSSCAAGSVSAAATATFSTLAPALCNAATNLAVSGVTATSATLTFTASTSATTNYTITTSPATTTQTVTASPVTLAGLAGGTTYTVTVQSNCTNGGTNTETLTFATPPANDNCAGAFTLVSGTSCTPTAGTVAGATQSQAATSCTGSTSTSALDVWYSFVASGTAHTVTLTSTFDGVLGIFNGACGSLTARTCSDSGVAGDTESISLTGLTANTRYYIRVYPYTSSGSPAPTVANSGFTICVTGTVVPTCDAPTNLAVSGITTTSASVSFTANALGASYTVTTTPASTTQTVTASPASLTGLTPGTAYTVNIATNCTNGVASAAATTTFSTSSGSVCTAPTSLTVSNVNTTSANISFTASASATSYTITTSPASTSQTVTGTTAILTGLTAGTTYTVSVVSNCAGGATSAAATASFTTLAATTTTISSSLNPSAFGQNVTLTGTVSSSSGTPTGTVTFFEGNTALGNLTLGASGVAMLTLNSLAVGSHSIVVVYNGAPGFSGSVSMALTQVVNQAATTTGLFSSANPSTFGQSVTLTAPVTNTDGTPTGTVTFFDGTTALGTGTLSSGVATLTTSTLAVGSHSITATYGGSTNYTGSTSVVFTQVVNAAAPTLTSLNPTSGPVGTSVIITGTSLTGATGVSFNGTAATAFTVDLPTQITATVPTGATTGNVTVTTGSGTSNGLTFTVTLTDLLVSTAQAVSGAYNNVTVTGSGVATLAGNLTVNGVMTVQSGGSVQTSPSFKIQGPGRFVLDAGATLIETTTAGVANTSTGGFLLAGSPALTLSTDANYTFAGTAAQATGPLLPAAVRNLTVNNSAGVTLTNNLRVAQVLRLTSGNFALNNHSFLLPSAAAGTALVDNTGGLVVGSTASMQRALTGGVAGAAYRHYSSPVASVLLDSLRTGGFVPVVNAGYNGSATPGTTTPFPTVFGYDQGRLATVTSNYSDFDKGWFSPASLGTAMQLSRGYTVNAPNTGVPVRFTGTLNSGSQNSGTLGRGTAADAGWQLLGNPYPAPLDWSTVTAAQRPGMDGAMYVFQSTGQYAGTYRTYTNGMGTSPLIEAGSGYFARVAASGGTGAVNLTNNNRITTFGVQNTFGRQAADQRPQLQLRVSGAGLVDDAYLYTEAGATSAVDAEYDAVKLFNPSGLSVASLAGTTPLAIQGLPTLAGSTERVIPLTLAAPAAGSFAFDVADLANFGTTVLYLRDALVGSQQQLAAGTHYSFTLASGTAGNGRFSLVLRPAEALATAAAFHAAAISLYPNPAHGSFTLLLPPVAGERAVQATLLNVLGQAVTSRSIALTAAGATATFDTRALAQGVYVLRLTAGGQTVVQRVTVE